MRGRVQAGLLALTVMAWTVPAWSAEVLVLDEACFKRAVRDQIPGSCKPQTRMNPGDYERQCQVALGLYTDALRFTGGNLAAIAKKNPKYNPRPKPGQTTWVGGLQDDRFRDALARATPALPGCLSAVEVITRAEYNKERAAWERSLVDAVKKMEEIGAATTAPSGR